MIWIWQQSNIIFLLCLLNSIFALQLPNLAGLLQPPAPPANTTASVTNSKVNMENIGC